MSLGCKTVALGCYTTAGLALVLLASSPIASAGEKVVYSFRGGADGANPDGPPVLVNGTLYGTTYRGGASGNGTLYGLTPAGSKVTLHAFAGGSDGQAPTGSLRYANGTLYGTTSGGGIARGYGTLFSYTTGGTYASLYDFPAHVGWLPNGDLIQLGANSPGGGALFGTAYGHNDENLGSVFKINGRDVGKLVYQFQAAGAGGHPAGGLIAVDGNLFGVTSGASANYPLGTVYEVTRSGLATVLHGFTGSSGDGAGPTGELVHGPGVLYGVTNGGGAHNCGTVFSVTPAGAERIVYAFGASANDGCRPSSLVGIGGRLYGTTMNGGAYSGGTVFSVAPDGTERVLHSFGGSGDGMLPAGGIRTAGGVLYGSTFLGGAYGFGTVFSYTP